MTDSRKTRLEAQLIDSRTEITLVQLCRRSDVEEERVKRLLDEGIIEPSRREGDTLYFRYECVKRTRVVTRLQSDLGVNVAGAALALELLEHIEQLKARLRLLETVGIK